MRQVKITVAKLSDLFVVVVLLEGKLTSTTETSADFFDALLLQDQSVNFQQYVGAPAYRSTFLAQDIQTAHNLIEAREKLIDITYE